MCLYGSLYLNISIFRVTSCIKFIKIIIILFHRQLQAKNALKRSKVMLKEVSKKMEPTLSTPCAPCTPCALFVKGSKLPYQRQPTNVVDV